jgi:hypothetical protein
MRESEEDMVEHRQRRINRTTVIVSVFLFSATVFFCARPQTPKGIKAKDWNITVGPKKCDLTDDDDNNNPAPKQVVQVNQYGIHWHSQNKHSLYLILHLPNGCSSPPFPFTGLTVTQLPSPDPQGRVQYLVRDEGPGNRDHIKSGKASTTSCACDPSVPDCETVVDPNNPKPWQIKYDQIFDDQSCDGWIIVKG